VAGQLRCDALFLVGNPKASVYRFRSAAVNAYTRRRRDPPGRALRDDRQFPLGEANLRFCNARFAARLDPDGDRNCQLSVVAPPATTLMCSSLSSSFVSAYAKADGFGGRDMRRLSKSIG
jgi:hypothetical protein